MTNPSGVERAEREEGAEGAGRGWSKNERPESLEAQEEGADMVESGRIKAMNTKNK